jgi:hypothetical protein
VRRRTLINLELHVAHSCNLRCESCSHYSDHGHSGLLAVEDAEDWMAPWSKRLEPKKFSLLGGEPAANPELTAFVPLARRHWPRAQLRIASNGLLLHRHPDLPKALAKAGNSVLDVSLHHVSDEYRARIEPVFELLRGWVRDHGIEVRFTHSYANWTRRYRGFGKAMEPFEDGDPRKSWEVCAAHHCRQLHEGKIWKCGPLAYLPMQHRKFGLSEKWRPYLAYRPLEPDCSDAELDAFLDQEEESACGMCPKSPERFELPVPLPARRMDRDSAQTELAAAPPSIAVEA